METYKPAPNVIASIKLLKCLTVEECKNIIKKAKPGFFDSDIAANILLVHAINKLSTAIEVLSSCGKCTDKSGND